MSVTLHTRSIVLLVAIAGVLVGFAVSQITAANSADDKLDVRDRAVLTQLKRMDRNVNTQLKSMDRSLDGILSSTGEMCRDVTGLFAGCPTR